MSIAIITNQVCLQRMSNSFEHLPFKHVQLLRTSCNFGEIWNSNIKASSSWCIEQAKLHQHCCQLPLPRGSTPSNWQKTLLRPSNCRARTCKTANNKYSPKFPKHHQNASHPNGCKLRKMVNKLLRSKEIHSEYYKEIHKQEKCEMNRT